MNLSLRPPGGERTWNAILIFVFGAALLWVGLSSSTKVFPVFGGVLVVSALGLWGRLGWARWTAGITLVLYAALVLLGMIHQKAIRATPLITMAGVLWIGWELLTDHDRRAKKRDPEPGEDAPPKPLTSLVLLLSAPRTLTAAELAPIASRAWGGPYGITDDVAKAGDESRWVAGKSPIFLLRSDEAIFMLHNFPAPYASDSAEMAPAISDLRIRKAVQDHRAWLAVDFMGPFDHSRPAESFYPAIGRILAELAGDDCLALFHPHSGRITAWDPSLKETLRGPDPLKDLGRAVHPPVLQVDQEDPELVAGTQEARRRLPEFVEAFRKKDGEHFSVKTALRRGGRTEHLWIEVDRIDDDRIAGKLGNEPVDLGGMKLGDAVEIARSEVEDWVVVRGDSPTGLFTVRAVGRKLRNPS